MFKTIYDLFHTGWAYPIGLAIGSVLLATSHFIMPLRKTKPEATLRRERKMLFGEEEITAPMDPSMRAHLRRKYGMDR